MSSDVLALRGISKSFGAVQAVRDVSIECRAGEIHGSLVWRTASSLLSIANGSEETARICHIRRRLMFIRTETGWASWTQWARGRAAC